MYIRSCVYYMNLFCGLVAVTCLLGMCSKNVGSHVNISERAIEYQLSADQYAVVIAVDGVSKSQAKQMAKQRAAEITVASGGRYFTIDQEQQTQVIKSEEEGPRFYGNMYQELIIEHDFNRERLRTMSEPNTQMYPAIRIVFTIYKDRPALKKAIDACKLTKC